MKSQEANQRDGRPLSELSPELRRVVGGIVQETPPEGLMQRILEGVRRQKATEASEQRRPLERRRQRRSMSWSFSGATAIAVAVCALASFAVSLFILRVPNHAVVPQMQVAVSQDLPTVWAYHKAIGESPEAIDQLLARHARQILRPEPNATYPYSLHPMP